MAFNRLYHITESSEQRLKNVKKNKKKYYLEQYKENILKDVQDAQNKNILNIIKSKENEIEETRLDRAYGDVSAEWADKYIAEKEAEIRKLREKLN